MRSDTSVYPEQFVVMPDLLHVVISREEIVEEMAQRGEHQVVGDVCWAVAVVADAIACALVQAQDR